MSELGEVKTPKFDVKNIPTWAYGVVIGVVILVGVWWYKQHQATTTTVTPAETDVSGLTDAQLLSAGSGGGNAGNSYSNSNQPTGLTTNAMWEAQALGYLGSMGYSPLSAQAALEDYLNGRPLDSTEQTMVNAALSRFGAPPEGIAGPITTTTTPTQPTQPVPTNPNPPMPTSVAVPSTTAQPVVIGLPVDSVGNNVAYDSQTGGSIQIGGITSPYENLPAGWQLITQNNTLPGDPTHSTSIPKGVYAVPPGAPSNPVLVDGGDAESYYYEIPSTWQYVSTLT